MVKYMDTPLGKSLMCLEGNKMLSYWKDYFFHITPPLHQPHLPPPAVICSKMPFNVSTAQFIFKNLIMYLRFYHERVIPLGSTALSPKVLYYTHYRRKPQLLSVSNMLELNTIATGQTKKPNKDACLSRGEGHTWSLGQRLGPLVAAWPSEKRPLVW